MTETQHFQAPARVAFVRLELGFVAYDEIFAAITDSLQQAGARVRMVDTPRDADPSQDDALLVVGAPGFYPTLTADLAALRAQHGRAVRVIVWQLEHLPDPDMPFYVVWAHVLKSLARAAKHGGTLDTMRGASFLLLRRLTQRRLIDTIYTLSRRGAEFLNQRGIAAQFLPLGHHPLWGIDRNRPRDIDVLFLGEVLDDRRSRIVKAVRDELAQAGVALRTMYDFNPVGVWGEERNALLNRTKVYLSVYRHPGASSGLRFSLGMGNGALIVSEPSSDTAPFVAGTHFVEAEVPDLARAVLAALRDETARDRMRAAAQAQLASSYYLSTSARTLIQAAKANGAHLTFAVQIGDASMAMRGPFQLLKGFISDNWKVDMTLAARPDNTDVTTLWDTVPVTRIGRGSMKSGILALARRVLKRHPGQIVLSFVWDWHGFALAFASRLFGAPYALFLDTFEYQASPALKGRLKDMLRYGFVLANARVVLAETPPALERVQRHFPRVNALAAPPCFWRHEMEAQEAAWQAQGITPVRRPVILFIGRVIRRKNIHDLIEAFSRLAGRFGEWTVEIRGTVNDQDYYADLTAQCAALGLDERVHFLPPVYGDALYREYAAAQIFCLPSQGEGMPSAIIEAMYFGGAIIAADAGCMAYQLDYGECGLIHAPGDITQLAACLETLMDSKETITTYQAKARARAETVFAWETYYPAIKAAFDKALK